MGSSVIVRDALRCGDYHTDVWSAHFSSVVMLEEIYRPLIIFASAHKHLVERLELRRRLYGILRNILDTAFLYFQSVCIELAVILFLQVSNETKSVALRRFYKITRFIDNLFVIA